MVPPYKKALLDGKGSPLFQVLLYGADFPLFSGPDLRLRLSAFGLTRKTGARQSKNGKTDKSAAEGFIK